MMFAGLLFPSVIISVSKLECWVCVHILCEYGFFVYRRCVVCSLLCRSLMLHSEMMLQLLTFYSSVLCAVWYVWCLGCSCEFCLLYCNNVIFFVISASCLSSSCLLLMLNCSMCIFVWFNVACRCLWKEHFSVSIPKLKANLFYILLHKRHTLGYMYSNISFFAKFTSDLLSINELF